MKNDPTIKEIIAHLNSLVSDMAGKQVDDNMRDFHTPIHNKIHLYLRSIGLTVSCWKVSEYHNCDYEKAICPWTTLFKYDVPGFIKSKGWEHYEGIVKGTIKKVKFYPCLKADPTTPLSKYFILGKLHHIDSNIRFVKEEIKDAKRMVKNKEKQLRQLTIEHQKTRRKIK